MLLTCYDHSRYPNVIVGIAIIIGMLTPIIPILLPWNIEMAFVGFLLMLCGRILRTLLLDSEDKKFNKPLLIYALIMVGSIGIYFLVCKINGIPNMSLSQMGGTKVFFPFRVFFFSLLGISEALFLSLYYLRLCPLQ